MIEERIKQVKLIREDLFRETNMSNKDIQIIKFAERIALRFAAKEMATNLDEINSELCKQLIKHPHSTEEYRK